MSAGQLSLYLDLEKGQNADLEITSRAALAFAETVREIALFLDPFSEVQLELVDTSEGSLFVNTKVKLVAFAGKARPTLYALSLLSAGCIGGHIFDFAFEKLETKAWEGMFGEEEAKLSEEDKQDIAERTAKAIKARVGEKPSQKVIEQLALDPAVKGVGFSDNPKNKPTNIFPRSRFSERISKPSSSIEILKKRTTTETKKVVLISPVLVQGKRRWKFKLGKKEFGAPILDSGFIDDVLTGKYPIIMKSDVEMTVELETKEDFVAGKWVATDRSVLRVIGAQTRYEGRQLSFSTEQNQTGGNQKNKK